MKNTKNEVSCGCSSIGGLQFIFNCECD